MYVWESVSATDKYKMDKYLVVKYVFFFCKF